MTLLSTKIQKEINTVLSNLNINDKAREEIAKNLTDKIIQLIRNAVTGPFIRMSEAVERLREVLK